MSTLPIASIISFFTQGGFFMILLLLCSFVSVTTILLRASALRDETVIPNVIREGIQRLQPGKDTERASRLARLVSGDSSHLGRIVNVVFQHLKWSKSENTEAAQTQARYEVLRMEKGLAVLEVITGIAPLLGLLGTVSGLVHVFSVLGVSEGAPDSHGIAIGIAEALNTTIVGLVIAIFSLIGYTYFSRKIEGITTEMESLVADLMVKCYQKQEETYHSQEDTNE